MSWLDKFIPGSPKTEAQNNASGANPPSNPGVNPSANPGSPSAEPAKPVDPLASFAKMYDNPTNPEAAPSFKLDATQLNTVAKTQNFMNGIDPALVERANNGDSKAIIEMMGEVSRNSYRAALEHGSTLTDSFVSARETHNNKGFGSKVKNELVNNELSGTLNFSNPVVRKQLIRTAEELQRQNPDASPADIKQMAQDYITELAKAITPQAAATSNGVPEPTNFDTWFDER